MRRYTLAAALLMAALVAAPASANPIAFVTGPSPVAIVAGTLTATGPTISEGQFLLDAGSGAAFASWPGLSFAGLGGGQVSPAALFGGAKKTGRGSGAFNGAAPQVQLPFQFVAVIFPIGSLEPSSPLLGWLTNGQPLTGEGSFVAGTPGGSLNGPAVPEPATVLLLSSGLAGMVLARRKRKKSGN